MKLRGIITQNCGGRGGGGILLTYIIRNNLVSLVSTVNIVAKKSGSRHIMNNNQSQTKLPQIINMVLLPKPVSITQQKLESTAQAMGLTNLSVTAQEGQDGAFVVFFNGMPFIIMSIDQPVPHETFNGVLQFSFGLENGKQIVERQKAHVIISPMADVQHMGQGIMSGVGVMVMTVISFPES